METLYKLPEDHIAWIRKERFGLALDGTVARANPLAATLQRTIEHLSQDLYSKETHFILELIQNAEDNRYGEDVKPDLTFILLSKDPTETPGTEGALLVINNEAGFQPEHVDVLCDVGRTTKTKREGYVGEKGIGFKSVFVVSSQPHVFSAGYQFRFQEEPDPQAQLGYIVPYWVSEIPPEVKVHGNKTCIVLPIKLKPGKQEQEDVAKGLKAIAPETILFLSKLQGLTVQIEGRRPIEVIRDDKNRPLVEFMTDDQIVEFWVSEQEPLVPSDLHEEKRENITSRKVSVALPLAADAGSSGQVFAFLPTRERSGFPFLINADFILSTSRESIQHDRPWNLWLRDCIAPVFVQAFTSLLDSPRYRARAYSYIPLGTDVHEEFFKATVGAIQDELRDRAVIWTFDGETLVKPSVARLAPTKFRELMKSADIPSQLRKTPLVHPDIKPYRQQLKALGIKDLTHEEIIECLKDESWLESQDLEWFIALYEYFSEQSWATEERLRELRLLPLQDGRISNTAEQPVYFPGEDVGEIRHLQAQTSHVLTIDFLNPRLYELLGTNQMLTQWLVDTLGVQELTQANYCLDLARGLNDHLAQISVPELVDLTIYIRGQFDAFDDYTQKEIADVLPLALAEGKIIEPQKWDNDHPLVMPEAMDPRHGWQLVFADPEDRAHMAVLSGAYLADCTKEEINKWRDFFGELGSTDAPHPKLVSGPTPESCEWDGYEEELFESFRKEFDRRYPDSRSWPTQEKVSNYRPLGWIEDSWLGPSQLGKRELRKRGQALVKWLDRKLDQCYRGEPSFGVARYTGFYRTQQCYEEWSTFKVAAFEATWFPTTRGPRVPREVFLDRAEFRDLFGDALPYALENPTEKVAKWLGLRQKATVDEFLKHLKELSSQPADQVDQKVVRKIYAFLSQRWRAEIKQQFEKNPLILVSKPEPRWVTAEQAVWPDQSAVFGEAYVYLESQYGPRFKEFFVEKIGIAEELSQELYVQAWTQLANSESVQAAVVEAALERIYPELLKIATGDAQPQRWQELCAKAKVVWTQSGCFEAADQVYVPDDGELKRHFTKEGVEFAWRPEKASFAKYQPLYCALGVHSLVEMVETSAEVQQVTEPDGRQPLLTPHAKKAICVYLWNTNLHEYERTKQSGVLEALLRTREQTVRSLTVSYKLNRWTTVQIPDSSAHWQQDEHVLYRSDVHSQDQLEIEMAAIVARRLAGGRTSNAMENFIGRILGASEAKVEGIVHKTNWNLPLGERKWIEEVLAPLASPLEREAKPEPEAETEAETESELEREPGPEVGPESKSKHKPKDTPRPKPEPEREPKPAPKPEPKPKPEPDRHRPRLRSYVEPGKRGGDGSPSGEGKSQEEREAIERAAIELAMEYERQHERIPEELPPNHEGWDIDSYAEDPVAAILDQAEKRRLARRIEVKATKYGWDGWGVGLTSPQHTAAQQHGEDYYLYVVEHALDLSKRTLYVFRNPAGKIADYRFDDVWTKIADETDRPDESI